MNCFESGQATHPHFSLQVGDGDMGLEQGFLPNSTSQVLDVIVECCTLRKPARIIHEKGIVDATFESASVDAVWFRIPEPSGAFVESISPCSIAFVARCRPCFFLSRLYVSHATKMFAELPDRVAVVERREARRFPISGGCDLRVSIKPDDGAEITARAIDISANGILVELDPDLKLDWTKGMRANVRLLCDGLEAELSGMVRRRAGTIRYGIAFPAWLSRDHLRPSHPFLRILRAVERK